MGGCGASSGMSKYGNAYGSQYHTLYQSGNIKFVAKNGRDAETLMETMTPGRVYVTVGGEDELQSIVYFDEKNMRAKQIDLAHPHKQLQPHTHHGYFHQEYDPSESRLGLSPKEAKMVERVRRSWENRNSRR